MSSSKPLTKSEQSRATVKKLIAVATKEFAAKGYACASTEVIVKTAGLTRGALYHHFNGKSGLFYAVFCQAQQEIGRRIEKKAESVSDLWEQLVSGCQAFLEASSDPELQQIVVIDAPSVLKWEAVRKVDTDEGSGFVLLRECLAKLATGKLIKPVPVDALAHLLNGAMDEAAVWISRSRNSKKALAQAKDALTTLLESLRT